MACVAAAPTCAQQAQKPRAASVPPQATNAAPPAGLEAPAPPYEPQLQRLSELLGALSYLRDLCGSGDGASVRARMSALLDAEASAGPRRDRIAGYFNRGFREYELLHRTCTPVSREAMRRAGDEAGRLAREIGNRFGGS